MTVKFDVVPYKAMPGFYVLATWPNGRTKQIDDNTIPDSEPAFQTEAEAFAWISGESADWLRRSEISN